MLPLSHPFGYSYPLHLAGIAPEGFTQRVDAYRRQLPPAPPRPLVLIAEPDPLAFLAALVAALTSDCDVVLANPAWGQSEWTAVFEQIAPTVALGPVPAMGGPQQAVSSLSNASIPQILIPTSGTTGSPRFVLHTWNTLSTAAQGFLNHFQTARASACCVLPLYHVSGLMQVIRAWLSGGRLLIQPFKALLAGEIALQPDTNWFISLVPTQLQRLIESGHQDWLAQFRAVLVGGAPAWPSLLTAACDLPLALTYGMSETAAQVATLLPEEFAAGHRSSGRVLPHADIQIVSESGALLPAGQMGQIIVQTPALALGSLGGAPFSDRFITDDVGYLDPAGYLQVRGRRSQKIITGGENVFPTEVEAALLATGQVADVCVIGLPDPEWGQAVTAVYVPSREQVTPTMLKQRISGQLSAYKCPKRWVAVEQLPRNAQGKLNRQQVLSLTSESASGSDPE